MEDFGFSPPTVFRILMSGQGLANPMKNDYPHKFRFLLPYWPPSISISPLLSLSTLVIQWLQKKEYMKHPLSHQVHGASQTGEKPYQMREVTHNLYLH